MTMSPKRIELNLGN